MGPQVLKGIKGVTSPVTPESIIRTQSWEPVENLTFYRNLKKASKDRAVTPSPWL